ncbi:FAD/NAD(P)-binding protein [Flavobacterium sp. 7A]|uniref:FAD/NAD(P)-binding protein n=1 Tax=Flavobacterium sp. 7A TaxID=2940571 RepID=UPI0022270916|nr:FAD/NAD(P)-binding protein [Flavobacterium sp. 7A]MCW2119988.1 hypothetical protein [Flavobacterium sp. 7A]
MRNNRLAIIGSGPTSIYLLKKISDNIEILKKDISCITIFEKGAILGMGMPYSPENTDIHNLANISSNEIPELPQSFGEWLRLQERSVLKSCNIDDKKIDDNAFYSRLALGQYFHSQYKLLLKKLRAGGIVVNELANHEVIDIIAYQGKSTVEIEVKKDHFYTFSRVVIATGHSWTEKDQPYKGYYASPWPISKLLSNKKYSNFKVGILGASLSAFDVVTTLAHRHGVFMESEKELVFRPHKNCMDFKIILHSSQGWLPNLQYEQEKLIREIYRHTTREEILSLVDDHGFLNIDVYFDAICRPALIIAFEKDKKNELIKVLEDPLIRFEDFINLMTNKRNYIDSFLGMQREMEFVLEALKNNEPTHWMETLDDLMYCLNFHVELLPAEDHLYFKKIIRPFLMNVIAAMPIGSAKILLALYDADCIDLVTGKVTILEGKPDDKKTSIEIKGNNDIVTSTSFDLFINCSGQNNIPFENYPFPSMINLGIIRKSRAKFKTQPSIIEIKSLAKPENLFYDHQMAFLHIDGIDIDASYRVVRQDGNIETKIHDLTFTHTSGCRPYSYGLQACCATSTILVDSWITLGANKNKIDIDTITEIYENDIEL